MAVILNVKRRVGHPWREDPEWDLMFVRGDDSREMSKFADKALESGWHPLVDGVDDDPQMDAHQHCMVFYKPHGGGRQNQEWADPYPWPYTQAMAADLSAGAPEQQQANGDQGGGNPAD